MERFLLTILFVAISVCTWAQEGRKERADKAYGKHAFITAGELYQSLIDQGYESADLYGKIGNTFYFNARYLEALGYYEKMLSLKVEVPKEYYFRYGQCLRVAGKDRKAEKYLNKFYESVGIDQASSSKLTGEITILPSKDFTLKDAGINSAVADFGTAYYGKDKIVFSSARDTGLFVTRKDKWNAMPFLKLYTATIKADGSLGEVEKLEGSVNSKYHQSTAAISSDGKTMYFTRNNYSEGKFGKDKNGINHLKIYKATLDNGKWKDVEELSINGEDYSTAHPTLSPDGKYLYFASDRPGSIGNSDLFRVQIKKDGNLGAVEHLGNEINTPGKESFPFLSEDGILYFSSNGHSGFGGLDVFMVTTDGFGKDRIVNLNEPINSSFDDFGFVTRSDGIGFLSSNREQNDGFDNIYSVHGTRTELQAMLCGQVVDSITQNPIAQSGIELRNANNEILTSVTSDDQGNFCFPVWPQEGYNLRTVAKGYEQKEIWISPLANQEKRSVTMELVRDMAEFKVGDDLAKQLNLNPIYFDFDGSGIRESSEIELAKVIAVLKKYPEFNLEVNSHTDSRGSRAYNQSLSERRAKSTVDFIIQKGQINPSRIQGNGYGESKPIKDCDTSHCIEQDHQLNRRSEFKLVLGK